MADNPTVENAQAQDRDAFSRNPEANKGANGTRAEREALDPNKAEADANAARVRAVEAQAKADDAGKSNEQREAERAKAEADNARAAANEARMASGGDQKSMSAGEARMFHGANPDTGIGDHMAQKFHNDPENPAPFRAEHSDPEQCTVRMSLKKSGEPREVFTTVHPEMVGDYERAGWSRVI